MEEVMIKVVSYDEARQEGLEAFADGGSFASCPYKHGHKRMGWQDGWEYANFKAAGWQEGSKA